jgi:hypothetical protein
MDDREEGDQREHREERTRDDRALPSMSWFRHR